MLVPYEVMHLGVAVAMPEWLAASALAPHLAAAPQFERLLTASATTAALCFLKGRVLRHATYLASLAACYLFRAVRTTSSLLANAAPLGCVAVQTTVCATMQDAPEQALQLWSIASRTMIHLGWRPISIQSLDKLLAAACLLHHGVASAAALQLLACTPAQIGLAFPSTADAGERVHACAWHALQYLCPKADLEMSELLFIDVHKCVASLFFGEVDDAGSAVLRPAAVAEAASATAPCAQLVGLAQRCTVCVCITSRFPVPVRITKCKLRLQHVVYQANAVAQEAAAPQSQDVATALGRKPSTRPPPAPQSAVGGAVAAPRVDDDGASSVSGPLRRRSHRRGASSLRSLPRALDAAPAPSLSANLAAPQSEPSADVPPALRNWMDSYSLDCSLATEGAEVEVQPGDNMLHFSACPVQEGVHLLDCVEAELACPMAHSVTIEAVSEAEKRVASEEVGLPFGAALVAAACEDNIEVSPILPGGAVFESCCQWVGVQIRRTQGDVQNLVVRPALRADATGGALVEFASILHRSAQPAPEVALGLPECAFWQHEGGCERLQLEAGGRVPLPGPLTSVGTLWLPVVCHQHAQLPELVDIGADAAAGEDADGRQGEAPAGEAHTGAIIEVAINYSAGCSRSKHVRLRIPVQVCI